MTKSAKKAFGSKQLFPAMSMEGIFRKDNCYNLYNHCERWGKGSGVCNLDRDPRFDSHVWMKLKCSTFLNTCPVLGAYPKAKQGRDPKTISSALAMKTFLRTKKSQPIHFENLPLTSQKVSEHDLELSTRSIGRANA